MFWKPNPDDNRRRDDICIKEEFLEVTGDGDIMS